MLDKLWNKEKKSADDFEWALLSEAEPECSTLIKNMPPDCFLLKDENKDKPTLLLLHHPENLKHYTQLFLSATHSKKPLLEEIKQQAEQQGFSTQMVNKEYASATQWVLTVSTGDVFKPIKIDQLVSNIFSLFLLSGRPLRHYHCTFFLPLDLRLDDELESPINTIPELEVKASDRVEPYLIEQPDSLLNKIKDSENPENPSLLLSNDEKHLQAYEFFYTHIQEQLFQSKSKEESTGEKKAGCQPIKHWQIKLDHLKNWTLDLEDTIGYEEEDKEAKKVKKAIIKTTSASLQDISLYEYYNGLSLLGIRVGFPDDIFNAIDSKDSKGYEDYREAYKKLVSVHLPQNLSR